MGPWHRGHGQRWIWPLWANALARGEGTAVQNALTCLAQAVPAREQLTARSWPASHLAMVVNGLAKGEGLAAQEALTRLAQAVCDRSLASWPPRELASTANGLSRG